MLQLIWKQMLAMQIDENENSPYISCFLATSLTDKLLF